MQREQLDNTQDEGLFDSLKDSEYEVMQSFEAAKRSLDSFEALNALCKLSESSSYEAFEAYSPVVLSSVTAGVDVDTDNLLSNFSAESLKDMIVRAGRAAIDAIVNFFKSLIKYLSEIDMAATWLSRKVAVLERKAIATRGKKSNSSTVEIGRLYKYLRVGRIYPEDAMRLERELDHLLSIIQLVNKDYTNAIIEAVNTLVNTAGNKTGIELEKTLVRHILDIPLDSLATKFKMSHAPKTRFNRDGVLETDPLLGGYSVFYMRSDLITKGSKGFRFHGYSYQNTTPEVFQIESSREFKTLAAADVAALPKYLKQILEAISKAANAERRGKLDRARSTLENFLKHKASSETTTESDMDSIRRTTMALTYWMDSVSRPLYSTSMSVCRAVITYCEKSIQTYG